MGEGNEDAKLKNATLSSLSVADDNKLQSIAFPAISTGIFGFPLDRCARIMIAAAVEFLKRPTSLTLVTFCLFSGEAFAIFQTEIEGVERQHRKGP
jgi:O-acetyl-ADP-ribose deacetylase (regulator of RNase III)